MRSRRPLRLALACLLTCAAGVFVGHAATPADAPSPSGIRWHADDYPGALAEARRTGRPLVVDLWAPWCHTCLSMKKTVLRDPALAPLADRFVWLALDTDRPVNAAALTRLPPEVWPTFFVVDPTDERIVARLLGSADVATFAAFLRRGAGPAPAEEHARTADAAAAAGRHAEAAKHYAAALTAGGDDWIRAPSVLVSRMNALYRAGAYADCVALGRDGLVRAARGHGPAAADFVYYIDACARTDDRVDAGEKAALEAASTALDRVLADAGAPLTVDDRSEALRIARELRLALGDAPGARARAEAQRRVLDAASTGADPRTAMTWLWPRAEVYAFLGEPAKLIPEFEAVAAALPGEYEPPYRLAWVQWKAGRLDAARGSARRAIERVYGPRAARAWQLLADIERARGDRAATRAALAEVVAVWKAQPEGQRRPAALAAAEATLAAFDAEAAPAK